MIKEFEVGKSCWVLWVGPKCNHKCPCEREAERLNAKEKPVRWYKQRLESCARKTN